jgi:hypothetical protein
MTSVASAKKLSDVKMLTCVGSEKQWVRAANKVRNRLRKVFNSPSFFDRLRDIRSSSPSLALAFTMPLPGRVPIPNINIPGLNIRFPRINLNLNILKILDFPLECPRALQANCNLIARMLKLVKKLYMYFANGIGRFLEIAAFPFKFIIGILMKKLCVSIPFIGKQCISGASP